MDKINNKLALISLKVIEFIVKTFKLLSLLVFLFVAKTFKIGERVLVSVLVGGIVIVLILFYADDLIRILIT